MSQFDFPRLHFNGLIDVNVGTGNNDDYSGDVFTNDSFNPPKPEYNGQPLRLANSVNVQPNTYGMKDDEWLAWTQNVQTFGDGNGGTKKLIPAEWNFYGGMGLTMKNVTIDGIEPSLGKLITDEGQNSLINAELSFNMRPGGNMASTGVICDVNPESVPSSQFIASNLLLEKNGTALMTGIPSKGSTRYINFLRNCGLNASGGASAVVYHTIGKEQLAGQEILTALGAEVTNNPNFKGVMIRYSLYRSMAPIGGFDYSPTALNGLVDLYKTGGLNAAVLQITGTISPWYEGELQTITMGRQLMPADSFTVPAGGNGTSFKIAPAIMRIDTANQSIGIDLVNSFPEQHTGAWNPNVETDNDKLDLGTVSLRLVVELSEKKQVVTTIGTVDYGTTNYLQRGGMVDLSFSGNNDFSIDDVNTGTYYFELYAEKLDKVLLQESVYMIASEHSTVYGEQNPSTTPTSSFNFNGTLVNCCFVAYKRGAPVTNISGGLTIQEFDTTPNQTVGKKGPVNTIENYQPGQTISVTTPNAGNKLFYCALPGQTATTYNDVGNNLLTYPIITMRVLPNENYDQYYVDPTIDQPVANDTLTFEILYDKVLRNYYLLYPAMSKHVPLNQKDAWNGPDMARRMYQRIQPSYWPKTEYMPRTRDLSESRRKLLQAWCLRVMQG